VAFLSVKKSNYQNTQSHQKFAWQTIMCAHYEACEQGLLEDLLQDGSPLLPPIYDTDIWPGKLAPVLIATGQGANPFAWQLASFGLMPAWAKATHYRYTYNARTETLLDKPSFRDPWRKLQLCAIPVAAFYEPEYTHGRAQMQRIRQIDKGVFWLAGLWECFSDVFGQNVWSHTLLTINAEQHPFMRRFHAVDDEKRSVIVLPTQAVKPWLTSESMQQAQAFWQPMQDNFTCA
jgi:putative SOS response-associated peptidase YedK